MKKLLAILLFLPLLLPAQQTMSAYQQALLQQEARRKQQTEKAQALRNRYRFQPTSRATAPSQTPRTVSPYRRQGSPAPYKKPYTPPAAPGKKAAPSYPRSSYQSPAARQGVYPSPKAPARSVRQQPSQPVVRSAPAPRVLPAVKPTRVPVRVTAPPPPVKTAPPPPKKIATVRIGQNVYFYLRDIASYYKMQLRFHKDGVEMFSFTGKKVRFYKKKRTGYINSTLVHFLFPPYLRGNTGYFIHSEDVRVILHPLLREPKTPSPISRRQKVILLDPGHGGSDTGALVPTLREKDMNLVMAWKVRKALLAFGYKVYLTRLGDSTLTLEQRAALCRKWKPDLFISLHCNAAADPKVRGIETFAATPCNTSSTGKTKPAHTKADPANKFDAENFHLAYQVQRSLLSYTAAPDRGVRHARFLVIRESIAPAILIEMGFITNKAEVKSFRLPAYQDKMANGIAVGIHLYAKERP